MADDITGLKADLFARLTSREYLKWTPERLLWRRPDRAPVVGVKTLRLPAQTVRQAVRWQEAVQDFSNEKIAARQFAQKHGLLEDSASMDVSVFDKARIQFRGFIKVGSHNNFELASMMLRNQPPPVAVNVEIVESDGMVEMELVPRDLLSGMWLIAIRGSLFNVKPVRICAYRFCEKPLTGTARNAFCSDYHRAAAAKNGHARDKRAFRALL